MSTTDLTGCFVLKRIHYCANRQVLRTNWAHTCLSALFTMNQEAATRYCDFQIQPADERVIKLDRSSFLVYTNRQLVTERYCGNGHETITVQEGTLLSVPPGCRVKLEQHQIYGESGISRAFANPKVFSWTWDAQRVLRNHSGPELTLAMHAMEHEAGMSSFETEDLLQQMEINQLQTALDESNKRQLELEDQASNPWAFVHWIGILISALVTFVAVTIIAGCLIRYFRHVQASWSKPSAPVLELPMIAPPPNQAPVAPRGFFRAM